MSTFDRLSLPPSYPESPRAGRRAAVAAVLGPDDQLLFIQRAERKGDPWSGDMAFPGGGAERHDVDLRATAARETLEEVGLDLRDARFHGALPPLEPLRLPLKSFHVHPYVWSVESWTPFLLSPEVAAVHHLPLAGLLDGRGRGVHTWSRWGLSRDMPCVRLEGTLVWGLTLRVVDDLVERLRAEP